MIRPPPSSPLFPYPTLSRSARRTGQRGARPAAEPGHTPRVPGTGLGRRARRRGQCQVLGRSEEHTSELQSHLNLVCRLLLEKKKKPSTTAPELTQRPCYLPP